MASAGHGVRAHIDALREEIEVNLVTSISERRFLPIDKVGEIFTLSTVKSAVQELNCQPEHRINLAETIYHHGKAVFAMLIDMWQEDLIIHFRKHGALDNEFPLDAARAQEIVGPSIARRLVSEVQWKFLPYIFPERMWECRAHIADQRILPFVSREQIGSGAFGEVEKISVYSSQQNFAETNAAEVHIVRKRLIADSGENEFEREDKCLRLLNGLRHPNIVPFLGSYTHKKQHNFLFPYIETDLGKLLLSQKRHGGFQWDFTFYAALTGLASALANTHRLVLEEGKHGVQFEAIGYHHDLRPPNILVSHDNFILADFGLGSLKGAGSLSHTPYKIISGDYIAPECTDMEEIPQTVNRAIDVWAFGCLILEVVTYMLKGSDGVKAFRDKRHTPGRLPRWKDSGFYQPQAYGGVKREVLEWIEDLRRDTSATDTESYLMNLSLDALKADPGKRPTMDEIHRRLAGASMLKHFESVQDMFGKICFARGQADSLQLHHLESLRLSQERFEIWGKVLSLRENSISSLREELPDNIVKVVTNLFHTLREEPDKRASGNLTSLRSLQDNMARTIKTLWDSLPSDLARQANDSLSPNDSFHEVREQGPSRSHVLPDEMRIQCATTPGDALLREFEDLAQAFKNGFSEAVSLEEITKTRSINDVYRIIDDLQHTQELRNLAKMELCLTRLEGYVGIVRDTIRGSSQYFPLVWGPVGLLLRRSREFDTAYIKVIEAMSEIGDAMPDFHIPDAFLRHNSESKEILVLFFKDLLQFYSATLQPFTHPGWIYKFDPSWRKVSALIPEISSHMTRLTRLMRTEIRFEHIHQEYEFRKNALEAFRKQAMETHQQEFHRIKTSIGPREYNHTLDKLRGLRSSTTGNWLLINEAYTEWFNNPEGASRVLWLKGIPGAGKTVLSSTVFDHLQSNRKLACFAFLTYKDEKASALSTMHSLIFQLAESDDELVDVICEMMNEEVKRDLSAASGLLKSLILHVGAVCLVIDGVDEIGETERGRMVKELLGLVNSCEGLRLILSSRPEADLKKDLKHVVVIQVNDHNEQNIGSYVKQSTQKMFEHRRVLRKHQTEITNLLAPLARRAKGMFLYARLIMDMVARTHDLSEIRNELAVLPETLDDAYYRIISRLDKHGNGKAKRLLGWIACTLSTLTIEEAQQALTVDSENPEQIYSVWTKLDPVELLGPIVETEGGDICFVHFTAKEYVCSSHLGSQLVDTTYSTLDLAIRCIDYLCQHHHDSSLSPQEVSKNVFTGQYSLDAFATRMWFELSCQYLRSVNELEASSTLLESIHRLWKRRKTQELTEFEEVDLFNDEESQSDIAYAIGDEIDHGFILERVKKQDPLVHHLLRRVSQFQRSSFNYTGEVNEDGLENEQGPVSTLDMSKRIRQILDSELCNDLSAKCVSLNGETHEKCDDILYYYGRRPFKCKFPRCEFWRHGFQIRTRRQQHERSHEIPLRCPIPGCKFGRIGFLSERMREKHIHDGHTSDPPQAGVDARDLADDSVEPLLYYLIAEDRVDDVRMILSTVSNSEQYKTQHFRRIASLEASPAMLQMLGENTSYQDKKECMLQSIKGRNVTTMGYSFTQLIRFEGFNWMAQRQTLSALLSTGWLEGLKLWCVGYRKYAERNTSLSGYERKPGKELQFLLNKPSLIKQALRHPSGQDALLFLYKDSGLLSLIDDSDLVTWASQQLRHVAKLGCSIKLAEELLRKGAMLEYQPRGDAGSALHWAADNTSAGAAELMRFLLLKGADPEATRKTKDRNNRSVEIIERARDAKGAQGIHKWLDKSWDDLVEETKQIRNERPAEQPLQSEKTEGTLQH